MYRKIQRYSNARVLSHSKDNILLVLLILCTLGLAAFLGVALPQVPQSQPQPDQDLMSVPNDFYSMYDVHIDRVVGIGYLSEEGWWNFERLINFTDVFDEFRAKVVLQSFTKNGQFRIIGGHNQTAKFENNVGRITLEGKVNDVNKTLSELEFQPHCIIDPNNSMEINVTFYQVGPQQNESFIDTEKQRRYNVNLNMNSGYHRQYRGRLFEQNLKANGQIPYFKALASNSDVHATISYPFSQCPPINLNVDSNGIFETNLTLLNFTIPYMIRVGATKTNFDPISIDYFVGGYPNSVKVELGPLIFIKGDNQNHNITGRLFDAFTNKTFSQNYQLSVYKGSADEINSTSWTPYENFNFVGNGDYYTGFYQFNNLASGSFVAVAESENYIKNFQRFYSLPSPPFTKDMRQIPLVPQLDDGELALVLSWGYSPRDLDLHVEFVASKTILCKCDFSMKNCGGTRYMLDSTQGGYKGSDVIKFDYIGDFQYIVYVSQFTHKQSPKADQVIHEDTLSDSQAQLKVFAPYYQWPIYVFDIPAKASNPSHKYWTVFCLNGREGLRNLTPINEFTSGAPDVATCHSIYGTPEFMKETNESENGQNQP